MAVETYCKAQDTVEPAPRFEMAEATTMPSFQILDGPFFSRARTQ